MDLARGEVQSFRAVEAAYERHKDVTLPRLYLEGMDEMLKHSGRVIVDLSAHGSSIVPYLPLADAERRASAAPPPADLPADPAAAGAAK